MAYPPVITCPKCDAAVRVAQLGLPIENETNGDNSSTILKRCPRCQTWSWMALQRQETV